MKVKYLRLDKNKRKEIKTKFLDTKTGMNIKKYLKIVLVCSISCIVLAIYFIIDSFINGGTIWDKIYGFCILTFGIAGIIAYRKVYIKKINEYVIKNKL